MEKKLRNKLLLIYIGLLLLSSYIMVPNCTHADVIERVVAIVNDDVILLSEFSRAYETARITDPGVAESEVLKKMIDRLLLLKQAKRFRLTTSAGKKITTLNEDAVIREYIDIRLKGFIHVPYEDIEYYYYQNIDKYDGREFYDVRNDIEEYLIDREFEVKLVEFINDLRRSAYIRVQLDEHK